MNPVFRVRYKIVTSFGLCALGIVAIVRLWSDAPPSFHTAAPYAILFVIVVAAFWRGVIFLRAFAGGAKP